MDLRQSSEYADYLEKSGWRTEKIGGVYVFIRRLPLTPFSVIKIQRPEKLPDLREIERLAREYRAVAVYIEPEQGKILKAQGYKLSKSPFLPTKTIQVDLSLSEEKLLAQMKKDTRYSIRKFKKSALSKRLKYEKAKEVKEFWRAWKRIGGFERIIPSLKNTLALKEAFGEKALFLTVVEEGKIVAGTIVLIADKSAYYYYAFTSKEGRKVLAQYGLVWEAIREVKKRGGRTFDFEGIYDERFPIKSWQGFSHFKKSFGGKEVVYPGCWKKGII